ncbi:MAG TPA: hypothetical protein VFH85_07795 [Gammaproteobacteria bacterium]|nr:hypothetical protein [Gammaproteobacteria bacterium]
MAAYQFLNPAPVLFTINGIEPVAGGTLSFFDEGTTNPRDTWNDPDLVSPGHLNANPITLDASGRSPVAIWLDGDYTVVLRDSIGDEVWSRVVRSDVTSSLAIPALAAGFLTNDLSNLLWQNILLIPDPTGSTNYILSTDGANLLWIPQTEPEPPADPDIVVGTGTLLAGVSDDTNKFSLVTKSETCSASGGKTASVGVVFDTPFSATPVYIGIQCTGGGQTSAGSFVHAQPTSPSASGFTASFSTLTGGTSADNQAPSNITSTINFTYVAIGNRTVA